MVDREEMALIRVIYGEAAIGYVAGMVDGEGSIGIYQFGNGRHTLVRITVCNIDKDSLEFCRKIIGGNISVLNSRPRYNSRTAYVLRVTNAPDVKRALHVLLPFLIVKKRIAQLVLEFIESKEKHYRGHTPRELEMVSESKKLNRRGLQ